MHVSCVVTALWYVHAQGPRGLRRVAWVVVPSIVLSTMALGIHWLTDVCVGLSVGLGCPFVVDRFVARSGHA
jgi:membrane-associated phospholipid phosphatase